MCFFDRVPGLLRREDRRDATLGVRGRRFLEGVLREDEDLRLGVGGRRERGREPRDATPEDQDMGEPVRDLGGLEGGEVASAEGVGSADMTDIVSTPGARVSPVPARTDQEKSGTSQEAMKPGKEKAALVAFSRLPGSMASSLCVDGMEGTRGGVCLPTWRPCPPTLARGREVPSRSSCRESNHFPGKDFRLPVDNWDSPEPGGFCSPSAVEPELLSFSLWGGGKGLTTRNRPGLWRGVTAFPEPRWAHLIMRVASIRTYRNQPTTRVIHDPAQSGIALMVVMVVFVVLYLVVYQLHFYDEHGGEDRVPALRRGGVLRLDALDGPLRHDPPRRGPEGGSPECLLLLGRARRRRAEGPGRGGEGGGEGSIPGGGDAGANPFAPISLETAGGGSSWYDYIHENIFQENRQQIGDTTVKVILSDGESKFDLNRLFDYVRLADDGCGRGGDRHPRGGRACRGERQVRRGCREEPPGARSFRSRARRRASEEGGGGRRRWRGGAGDEGPTAVGAEGEG